MLTCISTLSSQWEEKATRELPAPHPRAHFSNQGNELPGAAGVPGTTGESWLEKEGQRRAWHEWMNRLRKSVGKVGEKLRSHV